MPPKLEGRIERVTGNLGGGDVRDMFLVLIVVLLSQVYTNVKT